VSCNDCVFVDNLAKSRIAIPCNSCQGDSSDKGYCLASRSNFGYVPIVTKIFDYANASAILQRATNQGGQLELLQWSTQKNAFRHLGD